MVKYSSYLLNAVLFNYHEIFTEHLQYPCPRHNLIGNSDTFGKAPEDCHKLQTVFPRALCYELLLPICEDLNIWSCLTWSGHYWPVLCIQRLFNVSGRSHPFPSPPIVSLAMPKAESKALCLQIKCSLYWPTIAPSRLSLNKDL